MKRELTSEIMDAPGVPRTDLDKALRFIRFVNAQFGGIGATMLHLSRWAANWPREQTITMLDVGTGSADLPVAVASWARERERTLHITGLDRHATTVALANEFVAGSQAQRDVTIMQGDALELDELFEPDSFDYVHAGLFLHHLAEEQIVRVLASMSRIARRGIIWNDLVRSPVGSAMIYLATLGQPEIIKHDARVSVRAGFNRAEAMTLAGRAGIDYVQYRWSVFTHRFTVAGEKPALDAR